MVAILEKGAYNSDFHPMVDFIAAYPLRYALTVKPTIFVSHIQQFWSTARIETMDEGTHILVIMDGIQRIVSESSLRRNLKLIDEDGIVSIPNTELFENLTLMGIVPLFNTMLEHQGEGLGTPTEPHHTPSPKADTSHPPTSSIPLPSIPTAPIPPVTQPDTTPIRQYSRRARIAYLQRQYSELLAKFQAQEEEIVLLKERVQALEDREGVAAKQSGDDAPINERSINEGEAAAERISNDLEEIARVLTSIDAATVLAGGIDVPTGSGFIPTAGPPATIISTGSEVGPTASLIFTRRKGKDVLVESDTPKKKKLQEQIDAQVARELKEQQEKKDTRMNEQIARDAEVARIHAEEELQGMIDSLDKSNETIAKYLQEYQDFASELPLEKRIELISDLVKYQDNYSKVYKFKSQQRRPMTKKQKREYYMAMISNNLGWKVKDFKGLSFEEIEAKFAEVWKQVEDFIPMGSKEETERLKRKGLNLEQEQVKKQKSSDEAPEIETSTEEFTKEKMKEMMQLVPVEDVYVQALQIKHPIIDWKVHTEGQRSYWKIIRLGGSSACYQFFVDLLKRLDREDLNQLWALVKEYLSIRPATKWKLYDLSGVYHLTAKDKEIFMLVEKDYPLRKGLALVMISYKLQVENYSQMAEDLIRKIYNIANTLRRKEMPLPEVYTAIEEKKKKLPVKDRWQLH
nr:hypothetical protein [Tanacetum cinerariifolium]